MILKESVMCSPLNYASVAVVVIRYPFPFHPCPVPIHPYRSVIVLAFVKSSGKKTEKKGGRVSETTALLTEQDSLEGSLRDKVVSIRV